MPQTPYIDNKVRPHVKLDDKGRIIWTCHECGKRSPWSQGWTHFMGGVWCSEACMNAAAWGKGPHYVDTHANEVLYS